MYIEIIGTFLLTYTTFTLIVYGLVVAAVFLERKLTAVNAFYTIYMVSSIYCFEIVQNLNSHGVR